MDLKKINNISKFREDVYAEFERLSKFNSVLHRLLYETSEITNVYFVGGFLRNVVNNQPVRDLDVIMNYSTIQIKEQINKYGLTYKENSFSGFKIDLGKISIDIWSIHNNWAFKEGLVENYEDKIPTKIAKGTFFNYDSLVFDIRNQNTYIQLYNKCIESNCLDIIKKSSRYMNTNPGKLGNVYRAFYIRKNTGLLFSEKLAAYLLGLIYGSKVNSRVDAYQFLVKELPKHKRFNDKLTDFDLSEGLSYVHSIIQSDDEQLSLF